MVVYQTGAGLGGHDQQWQQSHADEQVCLCWRLALVPAGCFLASSDPPAIEVDEEDGVVHQRMRDGHLDARHHCALLRARGVLLPRAAVLLDHAYELDVAGHDGGDGGDEGAAHEEVGNAGHVKLRGRRAEARCQEAGLDISESEGVDDVDAP